MHTLTRTLAALAAATLIGVSGVACSTGTPGADPTTDSTPNPVDRFAETSAPGNANPAPGTSRNDGGGARVTVGDVRDYLDVSEDNFIFVPGGEACQISRIILGDDAIMEAMSHPASRFEVIVNGAPGIAVAFDSEYMEPAYVTACIDHLTTSLAQWPGGE